MLSHHALGTIFRQEDDFLLLEGKRLIKRQLCSTQHAHSCIEHRPQLLPSGGEATAEA